MWRYEVLFQIGSSPIERVWIPAEGFEDAESQARAMFNEPIEIVQIIRDRSKAYAHANQ
jgi:hypothetical protein